MIKLKGMTWDHVRGIAPLREATKQFSRLNPQVEITWDSRSLKDFEDYPVEKLADKYDFLLIDHPFVGTGIEKKVLSPLNNYVSESFLDDQAHNSVGKSFDSYSYNGKQWALAVDAAAQVSVYRDDLLKQMDLSVPRNWEDVLQFIKELPARFKVGMPLNPTHAYSSFLALGVNFGDAGFLKEDGFDKQAARESLHFLKRLLPMLHKSSIECNPIQMSEAMANEDEIIYVPLMYGYVPYARKEFVNHVLRFTNIPSAHAVPKGAVLGGVGLAISALSNHKDISGEFLQFVAGEEFQKGGYFESGGQPGHRIAWEDPIVNSQSNDFFKDTLETLDHSFLRPRFPGYPIFQEKASHTIHEFLRNGENDMEVVENLNQLFLNIRQNSQKNRKFLIL
jgi:multiple sugar transport system substrate-binding protein